MNDRYNVPKFVSIVAIVLGCVDLLRGFIHTFLLEYAAINIAGLDLSTSQAGDLLQLMGAFGISNYITGTMLILLGWKARPLALVMLGLIPAAYAAGMIGIKINAASYTPTSAAWSGVGPMMVYMGISLLSFIIGTAITLSRKKQAG